MRQVSQIIAWLLTTTGFDSLASSSATMPSERMAPQLKNRQSADLRSTDWANSARYSGVIRTMSLSRSTLSPSIFTTSNPAASRYVASSRLISSR